MWRPIATAPRDGTEILTCDDRGDYEASIRTCFWKVDHYGGEFWQDDADSEPDPTHWMPMLPKPEPCKHEWIDMRNALIESGEFCKTCGAIRAGNQATDKVI